LTGSVRTVDSGAPSADFSCSAMTFLVDWCWRNRALCPSYPRSIGTETALWSAALAPTSIR
jgi:hypothetical protein